MEAFGPKRRGTFMRSTRAADYQQTPRPLAVMPKSFASGSSTGSHSHVRGQVLYATQGLMLAETEAGAWAVPTGHALLIPPGLRHDISMHGEVHMLSAYVAEETWSSFAGAGCQVILASRLFDAALAALCDEPVLYEIGGRGDHLASVILDELKRAEVTELALPLPQAPRLRRICRKLLDDPGLSRDLDDWADAVATSRRTLTRTFRHETGMSFSEWKRRLRQLQSLKLREEGLPLKAIAARVGYRSPQALRAMLKRGPH
jgi:AraC-like DNA-binding protein/quercetin dioxygenase-like cupin family protein